VLLALEMSVIWTCSTVKKETLAVAQPKKGRTVDQKKIKIDRCPHCGKSILPLADWLRSQRRTLWTTAELVARYGGSEEYIGKELKRLGFAKRSIRHRLRDRSLTKKRAVYCVREMPNFATASPRQIRRRIASEHYEETSRHAANAVAKLLTTLSDTSKR
jgi:hypothetical protein